MAVDIPRGSTPQEPGEPVEAPSLTQMGATFAERAAAAKKTAKKVSSKAVEADDDKAENKAVAKKTASKKS